MNPYTLNPTKPGNPKPLNPTAETLNGTGVEWFVDKGRRVPAGLVFRVVWGFVWCSGFRVSSAGVGFRVQGS